MNDDTTISPLHQPGSILDPLTEIAREGARQMLAAALKAEAANFVARFAEERLSDGRQRVVHHGTGPERTIQLDPIGDAILTELDGTRSVAEVAQDLAARFDAPVMQVLEDVRGFLAALVDRRLVFLKEPCADHHMPEASAGSAQEPEDRT